jgi:catalase
MWQTGQGVIGARNSWDVEMNDAAANAFCEKSGSLPVAGVLRIHRAGRRCAQATASLPFRLVDQFNTVCGVHKGFRANHAKGSVFEGTFTPAATAKSLSKAAHLRGAGTAAATIGRPSTVSMIANANFRTVDALSMTDSNDRQNPVLRRLLDLFIG